MKPASHDVFSRASSKHSIGPKPASPFDACIAVGRFFSTTFSPFPKNAPPLSSANDGDGSQKKPRNRAQPVLPPAETNAFWLVKEPSRPPAKFQADRTELPAPTQLNVADNRPFGLTRFFGRGYSSERLAGVGI